MTCTPSPRPPMSEWPTNLMPLAAMGFTRGSCRSCRARSCDPAEHRAVGQPGAAGVVEPEDAAHQLARSIEALDRLAVGIDHLRVGVDLQAAEAEGNPAGDGICLERRRIQRVGPVGCVDRQIIRATTVLYGGI